MTRDDVLKEFYATPAVPGGSSDRMADEIIRLREQLRDTHTKVFHLEEKLTWVERERDQLTSLPAERILAALREPSEAVVKAVKDAIYEELGIDYWDGKTRRILYYAVAAAEKETLTESNND